MSDFIHLKENSPELQSFLDENSVKFNGDALIVLRLLYSGIRLTAMDLVSKYSIADRRLRDLHAEFPNTVKKAWVKDLNGKRKYVEYFVERPITKTKQDAIDWATNLLDNMKNGGYTQGSLL